MSLADLQREAPFQPRCVDCGQFLSPLTEERAVQGYYAYPS